MSGSAFGTEQVVGWINVAMGQFPGTEFEALPAQWHVIDETAGVIVAKMGKVMRDPNDGVRSETTNLLVLRRADNGKFSGEEDVYDPAVFVGQVQEWGERAPALGILSPEQTRLPRAAADLTPNPPAACGRRHWAPPASVIP